MSMFRRTITAISASVGFALTLGLGTAWAAPNKPAKTPVPADPDRPDKSERAVVFDDRYRPPAKDLQLSPGNEKKAQAFVYFMQGSMAEEAGEPDRALTFYLKSLAADPSNVALGLKVSSEHVRRGDTNEAVEVLKSVIKAAPQEPQPMLALSYIYLKSLRKPDLAQKFSAQALELDAGNFLAYSYLIDALQQLNQPLKANAVLERALKSNSVDSKFWLRLGETYYQTFVREDGKKISPEGIKKVNPVFAKAVELAGDDVETLNQVANYYVLSGQIPEAIPLYLKVLEVSPNQNSVREKLAYSYLQSEQRVKAIEVLEAMIKRNPAQAYAYEMLAKIYEDEKQYDRAVVNYEQALLLNPNQPGSYERMAEIFATQLKKPDKAIEVLNDARRRFPDLPEFGYLLARTLSLAKRHTEALAAFDMTRLEAEQNQESLLNGGFYFEWGAAAEQAGQYEKSAELFRKCLKIEDRPEVIAQASNYLGYMWVDRNENLEEAGQLIQRALSLAPNNGAYLDSLGWYYYRVGKFDKALIELLRAVENTEPPDATVFDHLAETYAKLKNEQQAMNFWQKALSLDPANDKITAKLSELKAKQPTTAALPAASPAATPAPPKKGE
jgi:tetratricopeptide (TPR) repeat protein